MSQYDKLYAASINDPEQFWREQGARIDWIKPYTKIKNTKFSKQEVSIRWYEDGELNICANCIDRHLPARADKVALIFEGDEPDNSRKITYAELYAEVCRFANVLKAQGVKRGDRITIYLPMILEAAYAMLACARIGAVHSVVFGGFSPQALAGRIEDCDSHFIITADEGVRGGKIIPLKNNCDAAAKLCDSIKKIIVVKNTGGEITMQDGRDVWYGDEAASVSAECPPVAMRAEDPLFILYTSGSTGKPKGVLHTSGGYIVYASLTHEQVFDLREDDIYWCTADVGWVTGHSYIIYGPLANGATSLMFEGVPNYPTSARFWEICDKHKVSIFYTAPTALRALMREGDAPLATTSRESLRVLGSVGEPINPEAWRWYNDKVGGGRCALVDTWWQTETGGILITPLASDKTDKAGSATKPFFGIKPVLMDSDGKELDGAAQGALCIADSWPGQMRSVYGDHPRFIETYFSQYDGYYFSGDGARRDDDGDYWITGRIDDVLNISGHRLGTAEVESALVAHPQIAEAAVVGFPHEIKGQGIYCFITPIAGVGGDDNLRDELRGLVRETIGAIASPDKMQFAPALPKTRSGKIMRRILRKIAEGEYESLGDTSTLAEPSVVDSLIKNKIN